MAKLKIIKYIYMIFKKCVLYYSQNFFFSLNTFYYKNKNIKTKNLKLIVNYNDRFTLSNSHSKQPNENSSPGGGCGI